MVSEKQLAANRRNARLSRGPETAAGKQRSALNNLRHGLTGQTTVLSDEDRAAHDRFCAGVVECLRPVGLLEMQIAQSVADDYWRLNRVSAIENNIFALGHYESPVSEDARNGAPKDPGIDAALNGARVFLTEAKQFALLSIYEQRIHRNLQKTIAELRGLQSARAQTSPPASVEKPRSKPVSNLTNVRPENGFEFANDQNRTMSVPEPVLNPTQLPEIGVSAPS